MFDGSCRALNFGPSLALEPVHLKYILAEALHATSPFDTEEQQHTHTHTPKTTTTANDAENMILWGLEKTKP